MVSQALQIKSEKSGTMHGLQRNLNCKSFGIYALKCTLCPALYVGKTKNSFRQRLNGHRNLWNTYEITADNDQAALLKHWTIHHPEQINVQPKKNKPKIYESWEMHFLEQPPDAKQLDVYENRWLDRLECSVNIQRMILPRLK